MSVTAFVLIMVMAPMASLQTNGVTSPTVEAHLHQLMRELPRDSLLRQELLRGARGSGVHYSWMDNMQQNGIKRGVIWLDIHFDRHGMPKRMTIARRQYFTKYDSDGALVSDDQRLDEIRASGLEKQLDNLAMARAAHGAWTDVPRPRPRPFVGGTAVEFLDDAWLPVRPVLYCSGPACHSDPHTQTR